MPEKVGKHALQWPHPRLVAVHLQVVQEVWY